MIWRSISKAVDILKNGGVIGLPTETVYGIAGSIYSDKALRGIFEIKNRPLYDPLIVHISNIEQLKSIFLEWPKEAQILASAFWPGPLTIVLKKQPQISPLITAGLDTVAVRFPAHPIARRIIQGAQVPLAAPSANKFGKTSPSNAQHVMEEFVEDNLFVVDGGPCEVGVESTVLTVSEGSITIFRPGMVSKGMIEEEFRKHGINPQVGYSESAASPGNISSHYMPAKPLVLIKGKEHLEDSDLSEIKARLNLSGSRYVTVNIDSQPIVAARMLYAELRSASEQDVDFLVAYYPASKDTRFDAIRDRLTRAATYTLSK